MPSQNPGIARNSTDIVRATLSDRLLGRKALTMPIGSPISHEISTDIRPISALIGPRWRISSDTLSPRKNERPRLPLAMSRIQRTYCTGNGSLSPRSSMMCARSAGASFANPSMPNIATSGSPGRIRSTTKTISETPSSVERPNSARRSRYFLTAFLRSCGGRGPRASRPSRSAREPAVVPALGVVDPEVRGRVLAPHLVVPGVVDLLVRDRQQRRVLLEDVLGLPHHRLAPVVVRLALDLACQIVE